MKGNRLLVPKKRYKAKRTPQKSKPVPIRTRQWWGIDMTKFLVEKVGWIYLVIVLDWYSRKIVGYEVGLRSQSCDWKEALNMAVNKECPLGSREYGLNLMSDNGSQPTSRSFTKECKTLGIKQAFTSYNNPKGNANTERVVRTIKEELIWISKWESLEEAQMAIVKWIEEDYNQNYLHSALGYISPVEFERECSLKKAA
jgi:transposase InsO family protein